MKGGAGNFLFNEFCSPAKVYLIIALFSLLYYVYTDQDMIWVVLKACLFIGWGFFLSQLCKMELKSIAWLLAFIPQGVFLFFTIKTTPATPRSPENNEAI